MSNYPLFLRLLRSQAAVCWFICQPLVVNAQFNDEPPQISTHVDLDEVGSSERSHLTRANAFLADDQWEDAIETLQRLMETGGNKLIVAAATKTTNRFARHIPLREFCQMRLSQMAFAAPEAITIYRRQVDPLAERWYNDAKERRDESLLKRIIDETFVSSFGDDALFALGTYAIQRGDFASARHCYERIAPGLRTPDLTDSSLRLPAGQPLWLALHGVEFEQAWGELSPTLNQNTQSTSMLTYPDSDIDLAQVRGRLALVSILEGSPRRAEIELEILRRLHPDADGRIAGREGKLVDLLTGLIEQSKDWSSPAEDANWMTFAGSYSRNKIAQKQIDIAGRAIWNVEFPNIEAGNEQIGQNRTRTGEDASAIMSYHPAVHDGIVFVNEFTRMRAFDLHTGLDWPKGAQGGIYDMRVEPTAIQPQREEHVGTARSTVTIHNNKLFARMGSPITSYANPNADQREVISEHRSYLIGLDLNAEGRLLPGFPIRLDGAKWKNWEFEGAPIAHDSSIYVAMRRRDNVNASAYVGCFDVRTGKLGWKSSSLGAAETPTHGVRHEVTHNLLTIRDGSIFVNTNLGVVAALNAKDGQIQWATRYPRFPLNARDPDKSTRHYFRDLNPCLLHKDLVIVAPTDCDEIFALSASTGQLIWSTGPEIAVDASQLIGVGQGNLIASGDYLYWIDVTTGRLVGQYPYPGLRGDEHGRPDPRGFGRGTLVGDNVCWPTREAIYVFQQRTRKTQNGWEPVGVKTVELTQRDAAGGNLIAAGGVLLITTANKLQAFNEYGSIPAEAE